MLPRTALLLGLCACSGDKDTGGTTDDTSGGGGTTEDTVYDSLDDVLEPIRADWGLPSLAAAVMEGDDLVSLGVVGQRRAGDASSTAADTDRYLLGGCTKAMTATLVAVLVEQGVLEWDVLVTDLLPNTDIHPDYQDATLSMLMGHVAGTWTDLTEHPFEWEALWEAGDPVAQRAALTESMLSVEPEFLPDASWGYSDAGYVVVATIVEERTGRAWEDLIQEYIFDELGMSSCGFGLPDDGSVSQPWGHTDKGEPVDPATVYADSLPALRPTSGVHCDLGDWGRFAAAHIAGAREESTWLSERSWRRLHGIVAQSYALGWVVTDRDWSDGLALSHAGPGESFYAVIWLAPNLNKAWLVSTNQADALFATDDVLELLIAQEGR